MRLSIGISPCPNDTFIFDALVNKLIDTGDLEFDLYLEDVQTLNEWALQGKLDILKISYGTYPLIRNNYALLRAGGALGRGVGPLLISKKEKPHADLHALRNAVNVSNIFLPGKNTTAHFLFTNTFPEAIHKNFVPFHLIEEGVLNDQADLGVIIHENRFTYAAKGLHQWCDLGELWEKNTGLPIPLGGIVMHNRFSSDTINFVNEKIRESLSYSRKHYPQLSPFVKQNAQEMSEDVMRKHIELYVNDFSDDIGYTGRMAIDEMLKVYEFIQTE
ncbi:MAG: 1,4-dihydroxy-6-naphthoate synthase [Bacteroidota bacterium]